MSKGFRTVLGFISAFIPPCFGLWLWYNWWANQDEWDYQGLLIK